MFTHTAANLSVQTDFAAAATVLERQGHKVNMPNARTLVTTADLTQVQAAVRSIVFEEDVYFAAAAAARKKFRF
jgi:hypothetical protein